MKKTELTLIDGGDRVARQATHWFVRLRADDTSESDRRQWRHWLQEDPAHRLAYERMERLWSSLGDFANTREVERRLRGGTGVPGERRWRGWHWPSLAATVLLAAGALALLVIPRQSPPDVTEYATGLGERRSVALEDGSRVELDAGTRLQVRFDKATRHVALLEGRAFFRVAKDGRRPFEVVSDQGGVLALGTRFEMSRLADALDVALYEGSVALLSKGEDAAARSRLGVMVPGQKARVANDRMALLPQTVVDGESPGWLEGRLVFSDTPLSEAVAEFNRYGPRRMVLGDAAVGRQRISGVFRGDDPQGFVEALREVYNVRDRLAADGTLLLEEPR